MTSSPRSQLNYLDWLEHGPCLVLRCLHVSFLVSVFSEGKMSKGSGDSVQAAQSSGSKPDLSSPSVVSAKSSSRGGLASVARLVKLGRCKNVVVVAGAGISTASGIPDFRLVFFSLSTYNCVFFFPVPLLRCKSVFIGYRKHQKRYWTFGILWATRWLLASLKWQRLHNILKMYMSKTSGLFQNSRNRSLRQLGEVQHSLPRSYFQHWLLLQRPAAFLLPGQSSVSRQPPTQLHTLFHPHAPSQRPAAPNVHPEHRRPGERWVRSQREMDLKMEL